MLYLSCIILAIPFSEWIFMTTTYDASNIENLAS